MMKSVSYLCRGVHEKPWCFGTRGSNANMEWCAVNFWSLIDGVVYPFACMEIGIQCKAFHLKH